MTKYSSNSERVSDFRRKLKAKVVDALGGKCKLCGYNKCFRALHFHHVDPTTKKFVLASYVCLSTVEFFEEAKKCVVLCSNCHAEVESGLEKSPEICQDNVIKLEGFKQDFIEEFKKKSFDKSCDFCKKSFVTFAKTQKYCCASCAGKSRKKLQHIVPEALAKMLWEMPTTKIAQKFNVSDKAVEKWATKYGLTKPPRGYWSKTHDAKNK